VQGDNPAGLLVELRAFLADPDAGTPNREVAPKG
jgi:hypothetical protein